LLQQGHVLGRDVLLPLLALLLKLRGRLGDLLLLLLGGLDPLLRRLNCLLVLPLGVGLLIVGRRDVRPLGLQFGGGHFRLGIGFGLARLGLLSARLLRLISG